MSALTATTFKYFFSGAYEELLRILEGQDCEKVTLVDDEACKSKLAMLRKLFVYLDLLVSVTRKNDKQAILAATIKYFGQFMTLFLGPCLTFLRAVIQRFPADVVSMIKMVQRSTRQIQSLCAHVKVTKETATLAHVPKIRKQLEQLIYH